MAIIGITTDRRNPSFTISDFKFWMPAFKKYMETEDGQTMFENLYPIANEMILHSIYGVQWKYAMSLCIAHYAYLIQQQETAPSGDTLSSIASGGANRGVISGASVGSFNVSYDLGKTTLEEKEAKWWNLSPYGAELMALLATRPVASMFVVTSNNIPGAN